MRHLNKTWPYEKQLKNRSSKHNGWFVGPGTKPAIWGFSNEALKKLASKNKNDGNIYEQELERRRRNAAKRKTPRPSSKKEA